VASDDSVEQPALACDLERTSAESILMVYDTLCSSSVSFCPQLLFQLPVLVSFDEFKISFCLAMG
jgi:hypothetical protein